MTAPKAGAAAAQPFPVWAAYLLLALACLLWAGNWVTGRAVRDLLSPVELAFWRWTVALMIMLPFALPRLGATLAVFRTHWRPLLALGIIGAGLFQVLVYGGLRYTTAINAMILNSSVPVFTMAASWVFLRQGATRLSILGAAISIVGIVVVAARGDMDVLLGLEVGIGDLIILLAMVLWAVYMAILKKWPTDLAPIDLLAVIGTIGWCCLLPVYIGDVLLHDRGLPPATPQVIGAIVYVAVCASVIAMMAWNKGVEVVGPNAAGFMNPLLPAFGTVLSIWFLGETLETYHLIGIGLILTGVFLSSVMRSAGVAAGLGRKS